MGKENSDRSNLELANEKTQQMDAVITCAIGYLKGRELPDFHINALMLLLSSLVAESLDLMAEELRDRGT